MEPDKEKNKEACLKILEGYSERMGIEFNDLVEIADEIARGGGGRSLSYDPEISWLDEADSFWFAMNGYMGTPIPEDKSLYFRCAC